MDLLSGTPYLLDAARASHVLAQANALAEQVQLLRRQGSLDEPVLARLRKEWGFQQVHESAAIEGNQLSLSETTIAIQRGITISGKPPEHSAEVRNLYSAIQYCEVLAKSATPVSEWELRELQSLIIGKDQPGAGAYRQIEVEITNSPHKPPHPVKVPEQMAEFSAWLLRAESLPVPLLCAVAHAWFVYIHPFSDGNGRTGRALMNLILIRAGYPIVVIRNKDRIRYYEALRASDNGDITPLFELFVDRCGDSMRQIDRIRTDATGLSLAVEKVLEADRRRYEVWAAATQLFVSSLLEHLRSVEHQLGCSLAISEYGSPSFEDYRALNEANPDGNSWLCRIILRRGDVTRSLLMWSGFASYEFQRAIGLSAPFAAIKLSSPNVTPPPTWIAVGDDFPGKAREFAFRAGRYHQLNVGGGSVAFDSAHQVTAKFAAELVEGWFGEAA